MENSLWKPTSFVFLLVFFLACKSTRLAENEPHDFQVTCYTLLDSIEANRPDEFDLGAYEETARETFSEKSLLMANALNLNDELAKLVGLPSSPDQQWEHFIHYQEIVNKISLAELEISSLSAALNCEEDKVEQLAWFLDREESKVSNRRTIAGILTDASASLVSAAIVLWAANGNTFRQLLGVGASLAQITLNLINKKETFTVSLEHDINILKEVFENDEDAYSNVIPPSVWYYIHKENMHFLGGNVRENLLLSLENYDVSGSFDLCLSDGGQYNVDQLRLRGAMLDLVSSYVDLMKQDLLIFRREVMAYRRKSPQHSPESGTQDD
ncbi:MAG: hypothetical protein JJU34_09920 [Lunatimonas sp.]|uniref:hypothetical protein n=1 Tax=Lunatimonas sp. TaxID=2060141 RepID=UPI00263AF088|nr:hypothetical protein [Lunatimonas sp.]MCC5937589.1 hypothetical protein [Lunatimonas sp.]